MPANWTTTTVGFRWECRRPTTSSPAPKVPAPAPRLSNESRPEEVAMHIVKRLTVPLKLHLPRRRARTMSHRLRPRLECLETRALPTVTFTPGPLTTPVVTGEGIPGGLDSGTPIEPAVSINPTDPANVVVSSQNGLKISMD